MDRDTYFARLQEMTNAVNEAERRDDYRGALALAIEAAEYCERHLPVGVAKRTCARHWDMAEHTAKRAGDVSAAKNAEARLMLLYPPGHFAPRAPLQMRADALDSNMLAAALDQGIRFEDRAELRRRITARLASWPKGKANPGDVDSYQLFRAMVAIDLMDGRPALSMRTLQSIRTYRRDRGLGQGWSTLYRDIAHDADRYGHPAVARAAWKLAVEEILEVMAKAPAQNEQSSQAGNLMPMAAEYMRNLIRAGQFREAAFQYRHVYGYARRHVRAHDAGSFDYLQLGGRAYSGFEDGAPVARTLYREAIAVYTVRQAYLKVADTAADKERRDAVPMFRDIVRNSWNLSR